MTDSANAMPLPRYNEYRVLISEGRGMDGGHLYNIGLVFFEENGSIRTNGGCSPRGFNLDSFKADLKQYAAALKKPWIFLPKDKEKPFQEVLPTVTRSLWRSGVDKEIDYRMGVDKRGYIYVYQCFKYPGVIRDGYYEAIQDCSSCGYSEKELIQDALRYIKCVDQPVIDVAKYNVD